MSEEPEDVDVLVNYMGIIVTEYISAQDEDSEQFIKVNYTYMRFGNHRCRHCMHAVGYRVYTCVAVTGRKRTLA